MKNFFMKNKKWIFLAIWGVVFFLIGAWTILALDWGVVYLSIFLLFPLNCFAVSFFYTKYNGTKPVLLIPAILMACYYAYIDLIVAMFCIVVAIVVGTILGRILIKKDD